MKNDQGAVLRVFIYQCVPVGLDANTVRCHLCHALSFSLSTKQSSLSFSQLFTTTTFLLSSLNVSASGLTDVIQARNFQVLVYLHFYL